VGKKVIGVLYTLWHPLIETLATKCIVRSGIGRDSRDEERW